MQTFPEFIAALAINGFDAGTFGNSSLET